MPFVSGKRDKLGVEICTRLVVLCWILGGMTCQREVRVEPELPAFGLEEKECLRFVDRRTGLRFCVPAGSQMQATGGNVEEDGQAFEIRLSMAEEGVEVFVRKDPLPTDLPAGALSGPWLRRYADAYTRLRGGKDAKTALLSQERLSFFGVESAAWLVLTFRAGTQEGREEALILAKSPATRIVLSWRLPIAERTAEEAQRIADILHLFLSSLRVEAR